MGTKKGKIILDFGRHDVPEETRVRKAVRKKIIKELEERFKKAFNELREEDIVIFEHYSVSEKRLNDISKSGDQKKTREEIKNDPSYREKKKEEEHAAGKGTREYHRLRDSELAGRNFTVKVESLSNDFDEKFKKFREIREEIDTAFAQGNVEKFIEKTIACSEGLGREVGIDRDEALRDDIIKLNEDNPGKNILVLRGFNHLSLAKMVEKEVGRQNVRVRTSGTPSLKTLLLIGHAPLTKENINKLRKETERVQKK